MNKIFVFFSFTLFIAVGALIGANTSVHALYDPNTIIESTVSTLHVNKSDGSNDHDVSFLWQNIITQNETTIDGLEIQNTNPTLLEDVRSAFTQRSSESSGFAVTQGIFGDQRIVYITIDDASNCQYNFDLVEGVVWTQCATYQILAYVNSSDKLQINTSYRSANTSYSGASLYNANSTGANHPYFAKMNINYPDGYTGVVPPLSVDSPLNPISLQPNIAIFSQKAWEVLLVDQNFSTFDKIWWTCDQETLNPIDNDTGFAPVLYYEIYSMNSDPPVLLQDGFNSATAQIPFKAQPAQSNTKYKIVAWYTCGGEQEITGNTHFEFTFTPQGTLTQDDLLQACFTETYPFIDIPACVSNMGIIINALSFGALSFTNNWESSTDCRNLTSLGTWINLPGYQVCPMVPAFVRTTITPFVTFILGLITVRFLTGRMGDDV